ncbi:hypothetical protein TPHV1_40143 [Treponema phagedenis]|uniref:Uncharacterized protein n=1 Tax=Treponema phagedenis TaxID=162 RepID=A0A0B7H080_TREPH|nr:hypothetical protein TPHV1_40143 [Treponema phagedenis]
MSREEYSLTGLTNEQGAAAPVPRFGVLRTSGWRFCKIFLFMLRIKGLGSP